MPASTWKHAETGCVGIGWRMGCLLLSRRTTSSVDGRRGSLFIKGKVGGTARCVKHITQRKTELEISYVGCKVICIEGNRRPLCLRITLAVSFPPGIWSSPSTQLHRIAELQHDRGEQGGFTALWVTLDNFLLLCFWNWNCGHKLLLFINSYWWSQLIVLMVLESNTVQRGDYLRLTVSACQIDMEVSAADRCPVWSFL